MKESFGMTLGQATRSHTAVQTLVSVCGLGMTLLLSLFACGDAPIRHPDSE